MAIDEPTRRTLPTYPVIAPRKKWYAMLIAPSAVASAPEPWTGPAASTAPAELTAISDEATPESYAFTLALVLVYWAVITWLVLHHVMWRDEWAIWLTGKLPSPKDVWNAQSHAGHPIAWFECGWLFAHIGTYPWGLKIFHALISTSYVFLVARFAPFSRIQKVLFAFGYFPLFEYGTIMRDYSPEMLGLVLACIVMTRRRRSPILFGVAIAYISQTTAYGNVIAVALGITYLFDIWFDRATPERQTTLARLPGGMAIALAGMAFAYLHTRESSAAHAITIIKHPGTHVEWMRDAFAYIWRGIIPVQFAGQWNTNFLDLWPWLQFALGILLLLSFASLLAVRPTAAVFFVCGILALAGFSFWFWGASLRHQGHNFAVLIVAAWLAGKGKPLTLERPRRWFSALAKWDRHFPAALTAVLAVNCVVGITTATFERIHPFSSSREAAEIIQQKAPGLPVIGDLDYAVSSVAGYLDRPVYIPYLKKYITYQYEASDRRLDPTPPEQIAEAIRQISEEQKSDVVLILNYPLKVGGNNVEFLGQTGPCMVGDEAYVIYRIHYIPPPPQSPPDVNPLHL